MSKVNILSPLLNIDIRLIPLKTATLHTHHVLHMTAESDPHCPAVRSILPSLCGLPQVPTLVTHECNNLQ